MTNPEIIKRAFVSLSRINVVLILLLSIYLFPQPSAYLTTIDVNPMIKEWPKSHNNFPTNFVDKFDSGLNDYGNPIKTIEQAKTDYSALSPRQLSQSVLLMYADTNASAEPMFEKLSNLGFTVNTLSVVNSLPSVEFLLDYGIIMTWSNNVPLVNNSQWGNLLADYIDFGGRVIHMPFTYSLDASSLGGRFLLEEYSTFTYVESENITAEYSGKQSHVIVDGITAYPTNNAIMTEATKGTQVLATYEGGIIFLSLKGRVLGINSYLPQNMLGDFDILLTNVVKFMLESDLDPPLITQPADIALELGTQNQRISWTISELNPATYAIVKDGVRIINTTYVNTQVIQTSLEGLTLGTHTFTITALDDSGNSASDSVQVFVSDTTAPMVSSPADISLAFGTVGSNISWTLSDEDPDTYSVSINGTIFTNDTYSNGEIISVNLDGFNIGTYNFNITVSDKSGNLATDLVVVNFSDVVGPGITHPDDVTLELGNTGVNISWTLIDTNPAIFWIVQNGEVIVNTTFVNNEIISISLAGLELGSYIFIISAFDAVGNLVTDTVLVNIVDTTPPSVSSEPNLLYEQGTTGNPIGWTLSDADPNNFEVLQNGSLVLSDTWLDGDRIVINVDELSLGTHNFKIVVHDGSG
ncbi:MAG: hypothetical protein IH840_04820, partial [Candidatus Heimdallarchaeota archaeon]|nr:hypothetical protein [Candidatus Heimdallarchaeota archaeon]